MAPEIEQVATPRTHSLSTKRDMDVLHADKHQRFLKVRPREQVQYPNAFICVSVST